MKIKNVTITEKELCKAVEMYLVTQGVNLPVGSVEKKYSYATTYEVEFKERDEIELPDDTKPIVLPASDPKPTALDPKFPLPAYEELSQGGAALPKERP